MSGTAKNSSATAIGRARGRFAPGVSGNPKGRPPGSANRATKAIKRAFMEALDVLDERSMAAKGVPFLVATAEKFPKEFMRTLARLAPRELAVRSEHTRKISPAFYEELRQRALDAGQKAGMIIDIPPAETAVDRIETDGAAE